MITQINKTIQAIGEKVNSEIPIVQEASGGAIYILIKDLAEKTANYIEGKTDDGMETDMGIELPLLPEDYEKMVIAGWRSRGFECTYCRQSMEYMKRDAIIRYLHVKNPGTGVSIFLIPWFMLPRKKYPVQVYAYAAWYSTYAEKPAGVTESAEVVKELFGLETFDPSTVYRSREQITRLLREQREKGVALSNQEPKTATTEAIIDWVTDLLEKQPTDEPKKHAEVVKAAGIDTQPIAAVDEADEQTNEAQRCSEEARDSGENEGGAALVTGGRAARRANDDSEIARVLGNIPRTLKEVKKPRISVTQHERRERAPRGRGERLPAEHKEIDFIKPNQLKTIRDEFTRNCKNIVLNAALIYHKLLN